MIKSLSLSVCVLLVAAASTARDKTPDIVWGSVSNDCRLGVRIQTGFSEGAEVPKQTILYLGMTNVAKSKTLFCPAPTESFSLILRDSSGKEVRRTRLGEKYGKTPANQARLQDLPPSGTKRWRALTVPQAWEVQIAFLNLMDHFRLSEPGDYELIIEVRLYDMTGQGQLDLFRLPPCSVKFRFD